MNSKALTQSIKALSANPVRTVLTTLGIMIGIATVITVLSAGAGFNSLINNEVASLGNNTLFIKTKVPPTTKNRAASSITGGLSPGIAVGITTFNQRDLDDIKKLNNVANDYGEVTGMAVASYRNNNKSAIYYGASYEKFSIDEHQLSEGRFYTQAEDAGASQVVILGSTIAKDLFVQDDPLGKLVRVGNLNFQVIGVYKAQGGGDTGPDGGLYVPLKTAQYKMLGINYITVGVVQLQNMLVLVRVEMKRLGHLCRRVSARASIGHGQAGGDAVRGEEQIAVGGFKPGVEVQCEGCVAPGKTFDFVGGLCVRWTTDQCGHKQCDKCSVRGWFICLKCFLAVVLNCSFISFLLL